MSVSLLDIGRLSKSVVIRGVTLPVKGISALDLFRLLEVFPELRRMFGGTEVRPEELFKQAPGAIDAVLCYVLGVEAISAAPGYNADMHNAVQNLSLGEQLEIVHAAWELTFPRGISSFFDALEAMGVAPASTKGRGTTSQEQSSNSLPQDTEQTKPGDTPQDN